MAIPAQKPIVNRLASYFGGLSLLVTILLLATAGCGLGGIGARTAPASSSPSPTAIASAMPSVTTSPVISPSPTGASSSPTAALTTVPTATPAVAATAAPQATVAGYQAAPVFNKAMHDYEGGFMGYVKHNYIGVPVEAAHDTKMAEQAFGRTGNSGCSSRDTLFLWREDTKQIYVMLVGTTGLHMESCRDGWFAYADTWQTGDPNNDDLRAPDGTVIPLGGFGKVWRQSYYGKTINGLGFPKAPERYLTGTVQRFENATLFHIQDTGDIYVLFDKFNYYTRGGETTQSVWFRS